MSTISLRSASHTFTALAYGMVRAATVASIRVPDILFGWHERASQRRALSMLTDHQLKDIGISRADAVREAAKPFWAP
jgi:uncharacterized protein YjiS (DUF1127 family)